MPPLKTSRIETVNADLSSEIIKVRSEIQLLGLKMVGILAFFSFFVVLLAQPENILFQYPPLFFGLYLF